MIPVFLQVLPLLSGVMFAVDQIPEKWQWILAAQPDDVGDRGWRWAMLDASAPEPGPGRRRRRRRARAVRRRARRLPLVRAALRGHDLMSVAIDVESLSKKYRIGEYHAAYGTLRETHRARGKRLTGQEHDRPAHGDLGAPGRLVRRSGRARCSGSSAATAPASRRSSRSSRGSRRPTAGRAEIRGRVGQPARGRDGLPPGAHRPRERLSQRRDPRHEAQGDRAALRRHRRVLRRREVHRHAR